MLSGLSGRSVAAARLTGKPVKVEASDTALHDLVTRRDVCAALARQADKDLTVADRDLNRRQPHRRIAWMTAGLQIEFIAVPRADDVPLLAETQPRALFVGGNQLFDLIENLALADRAAGVRAHILIGHHPIAETENTHFHRIERKDAIIAFGEVCELGDRDFVHPRPFVHACPRI